MRNQEIVKRMARQSGVSQAEAADRLSQVVQQILSSLRQGKSAPLPGLGKFTQVINGPIAFVPDPKKLKGKGA